MKKTPILIAAIILGGFAVAGVGLVSATHILTDQRIAENQRQAMLTKLEAILPAARVANDPLNDRIQVSAPALLGSESTEVYRVRDAQGEPVAVVLKPIVPDGYAGPIHLLVSVLQDGSLGGVRVLVHHETPGLGDKIEERKSDWVIREFNGKSLSNPPLAQWTVKRDGGDFDQFTGATITPRSIVRAVKKTLLYVQEQGEWLYRTASASEAQASAEKTDAPFAPTQLTPLGRREPQADATQASAIRAHVIQGARSDSAGQSESGAWTLAGATH